MKKNLVGEWDKHKGKEGGRGKGWEGKRWEGKGRERKGREGEGRGWKGRERKGKLHGHIPMFATKYGVGNMDSSILYQR